MPLEIFNNIEQGSDQWHAMRCGLITCSEFGTVLAKGKGGGESVTRRKYMLTLIGERIAGRVEQGFTNLHMERGKALEDEARNLYSFMTDVDVHGVGFMRHGHVGYSPDGAIGDAGLVEIKNKIFHLHLECMLSGVVPPEHKPQLQGGLWVSEREWIDFVSHSQGLPIFVKRVYRDEDYIKNLAAEVARFNNELLELIEKIQPTKAAA